MPSRNGGASILIAAAIGAMLSVAAQTGPVSARDAALPVCVPDAFPSNWLVLEERDGGHTLERHVGKSTQQLEERLRRDRHIPAASSFKNRRVARKFLTRTLKRNRHKLNMWAAGAGRGDRRVIQDSSFETVGRFMSRKGEYKDVKAYKIVLERAKNPGDCFVLTAYPVK